MQFKSLIDYVVAALCYLLINFVVFHGSLYRYLCKPESYAGNVYSRLQVLKEIERKTNDGVVAFVGDSITEEGVDAARFSANTGQVAANLALPGASPLDLSFFLRAIDPDKERFEAIVLTFIPQNVRTQAHDDGIQTLLPVANISLMLEYLSTRRNPWRHREDYYVAFDRIFGFRRDLRELFLNPDRWRNLIQDRQEQLEKVRNYDGQPFDVCEVKINPNNRRVISWGDVHDAETRRLTRHNINRIARLNRKPEASGIGEPLRRITESYGNTNTEVIVISVPFGPGNHINTDAPVIKKYLTDVERLGRASRMQHWTAFQLGFFHDCSNFFDYRHLNHKGRQIFSDWIAQQWARTSMQRR